MITILLLILSSLSLLAGLIAHLGLIGTFKTKKQNDFQADVRVEQARVTTGILP